jgi:hypothetical protein
MQNKLDKLMLTNKKKKIKRMKDPVMNNHPNINYFWMITLNCLTIIKINHNNNNNNFINKIYLMIKI